MPYAKLRSDLLVARSRRHELLLQNFPKDSASLLQLSLNIPGIDKQAAGSTELFTWARQELQTRLAPLTEIFVEKDPLGPWGLFRSPLSVPQAKILAVGIEEGADFARLLDIDVYDSSGRSCDRHQLGLAERSCLLCELAAKECIRLQRHNPSQLKAQLEKRLKPFTS